MRSITSIALIATACLLGAGCAGTRPVHYYTLEPATAPAGQGNPDGATILVGNIATETLLAEIKARGAHGPEIYSLEDLIQVSARLARDFSAAAK